MARNLIVGGGFAAFCCSLVIKDSVVLTPINWEKFHNLSECNYHFTLNKILGKKSRSWSDLRSALNGVVLHSRNIIGGNSTIWGGFIDTSNISNDLISLLEDQGIRLVDLSLEVTGSFSEKDSIKQLQHNDRVLDCSELISVDLPYKLHRFSIETLGTRCHYLDPKEPGTLDVHGMLYLCCGVVDSLEILYRSGVIRDDDILSLDEYKTNNRFMFFKDLDKEYLCNQITYGFSRSLCHFLGIQRSIIKRINFPFIVQNFLRKAEVLNFRIDNYELIGSSEGTFGSSIHYCNLKVNGIKINEYLKSKGAQVRVCGMLGVAQGEPGPISNDILNQIWGLMHEQS